MAASTDSVVITRAILHHQSTVGSPAVDSIKQFPWGVPGVIWNIRRPSLTTCNPTTSTDDIRFADVNDKTNLKITEKRLDLNVTPYWRGIFLYIF